MRPTCPDGRKTATVAAEFIKPNDRLTSFERLEIYNRQYWFRVLECFYDDYPGLRAVLGERAFLKLAEAYLFKYPSASFSLRNLGSRLEKFVQQEPQLAGKAAVPGSGRDSLRMGANRGLRRRDKASRGYFRVNRNYADKLKLGIQPYITLLALDFPVDDFVIAVKKHEALRGAASNAMDAAPKAAKLNKVPIPRRGALHVAVHRHKNSLYYKRLEPEAFNLLNALRKGATLESACNRAIRRASPRVDWQKKMEIWFTNWSALGWFFQIK